jgi:microcystin-dependent protein
MVALNFPTNPQDGDRYEDYFYDEPSEAWRLDPFPLETGPTGPTGPPGKFTVSETAPVDPDEGDVWFYSVDGTSFIWYVDEDGGQWIEFGTLSFGPPGERGLDGDRGPTGPRGLSDTPAGVILPWASSTPPANWLICDGSLVDKDQYPSLFDVIGYTYGSDEEDPDMFGLPNLKGRVVVGFDSTNSEFNIVGKLGGTETHTLSVGQLPSHTHAPVAHTHGASGALTTNNTGGHSHGGGTNSAGDHGHNSSIGSAGSHSHGGSTGTAGAHTHNELRASTISFSTSNRASGNFTTVVGISSVNNSTTTTGSSGSHTHGLSTNTDGSHSHSISIGVGGAHSHSISTNNEGSHSHNITVPTALASVLNAGNDEPHNNLQPYMALNYIIKATAAEVPGEPELAVRVTALENMSEVFTVPTDSIVLDFAFGDWIYTRNVSGNVVFSVFAYQAGAERVVRLVGDSEIRTLTFPTGWVFLGARPTELAENAVGVLTVRSFGTSESNAVAEWGVSV